MSHVLYASVVGSLMYAMLYTRMNIAHVVGVLSMYMSKLGKENWETVKSVFKNLCCTTGYAFFYQGRPRLDRVLDIHGFVDSNWARYLDIKIYTNGYVFNLFRGVISWRSKRQFVVALSKTKVGYMVCTHAIKEIIWLAIFCLGIRNIVTDETGTIT